MNLYALLASTAGAFTLLHFVAVPWANAVLRRTIASNILARAALRSTLDLARTVALIATISAALAIGALWVVRLVGGSSVVELTATLDRMRAARGFLTEIDPTLTVITTVVLIAAMVVLARRQARMSASKAYDEAISLEVDRVLEDGRNGRWRQLEPTTAIQKIAADMAKLETERSGLQAEIDRPPPEPTAAGQGTETQLGEHERAVGFAQTRITRIEERLQLLHQAMLREEVQRRMDVRLDPTSLIPRQPTSLSGRLTTLLVSRGVLSSLRGMSRVAFLASVLLLFPSMLALAAPTVGAELTTRITSVEQLRVEMDRKEATAAVDALKEAEAQEAPAAPADAQALDALARQYEISLARHYAQQLDWPAEARSGSIADELSHERVRNQIVGADANRAVVHLTDIPAGDVRMGDLERAARDTSGPVTSAGRDFRANLDRTFRQGMPRRWQELREATIHAMAGFQRIPTPNELRGMLVSNIVHAGADGVAPDLASLVAGLDPNWLERTRLAETAHLTESLANGTPPRAAFDEFASRHWHIPDPDHLLLQLRTVAQRTPSEEDILRRAREVHPNYTPKASPNADDSHELMSHFNSAAYGEAGSDRGPPEAMLGFNDHFPGSMPPEPPPSGGLPGGGGFGGGGGGFGGGGGAGAERPSVPQPTPGGGAAVATEAAEGAEQVAQAAGVELERVAMARSFSRLSGFSRIGGVLIGRPPSNEPNLDFSGIDWRRDGQSVTLSVKRGDGHDIALGPFRPEIVHLALAYAADGRPVTATMVTAAPLRELKILLHPALEDTAMGCRAIEVDRLVDRFSDDADDKTPSSRAVQSARVESFLELYRWAWAVTVTTAHEQAPTAKVGPLVNQVIDYVADDASSILQPDAETEGVLKQALADRRYLQDPDYSPLPLKTDYFAAQQVSRLAACTKDTLAATRACLREGVPLLLNQTLSDKRMDWAAPPPRFTIWSGVREVPFQTDQNLAFADPSQRPQPGSPFAPLSFILQIAFTSEPILAKPDHPWYRLNEDDLASVSDEHPWQFPRLQSWIDQRVSSGIAGAPDAQDTYGAVREFTVLQRLFRLALNGGLGPKFPVERLTTLATESKDWVRPGVRTPRWNPRPGALEATALRAADDLSTMDDQPEPLRKAASSCFDKFAPLLLSRTSSLSDHVRLAAVSPADWQASCPIPPADGEPVGGDAKAAVQAFTRASAARELRQRLGVPQDDQAMLDRQEQGCPPF